MIAVDRLVSLFLLVVRHLRVVGGAHLLLRRQLVYLQHLLVHL
jgi:hypothetical protein